MTLAYYLIYSKYTIVIVVIVTIKYIIRVELDIKIAIRIVY